MCDDPCSIPIFHPQIWVQVLPYIHKLISTHTNITLPKPNIPSHYTNLSFNSNDTVSSRSDWGLIHQIGYLVVREKLRSFWYCSPQSFKIHEGVDLKIIPRWYGTHDPPTPTYLHLKGYDPYMLRPSSPIHPHWHAHVPPTVSTQALWRRNSPTVSSNFPITNIFHGAKPLPEPLHHDTAQPFISHYCNIGLWNFFLIQVTHVWRLLYILYLQWSSPQEWKSITFGCLKQWELWWGV